MSGYTLIDPPVNPFSPVDEIEAWVRHCERQVADEPDNEQWRAALRDAKVVLEMARSIMQPAAGSDAA